MMCAYAHPACERALERMEGLGRAGAALAKGALVAAALGVGAVWYTRVYTLDKFAYNAVHPFTSWIPITIWCVLRNLTPGLRGVHIEFLAWMGKITLETYISQFHVWLRTGVPDAQPGKLLMLLHDYPLLNFMAATVLYVVVSKRVFEVTNTLKNACVPLADNSALAHNAAVGAAGAGALLVAAAVLRQLLALQ